MWRLADRRRQGVVVVVCRRRMVVFFSSRCRGDAEKCQFKGEAVEIRRFLRRDAAGIPATNEQTKVRPERL